MASRRPAPNPTYGAGSTALLGTPLDYSGASFEPSDPFAALAGSPLMGPALVPTGGAVPSSLDLSGTPLGEALNGPEMTLLRQMAPPPQLEPLPDLSGLAPQGFMERLAAQTGGNPIPFPTAVPPSGGAGFLAGLLHGLGQGLVGPPSAALQARQLALASRVEAVNKANEAKIKDYYASKAEQQKNIAQALLDSAKARGGRTLSIPAYLQDTAKSFGYQPDEKVNPAEMMRLTASGPMSPEKYAQQIQLAGRTAEARSQFTVPGGPQTVDEVADAIYEGKVAPEPTGYGMRGMWGQIVASLVRRHPDFNLEVKQGEWYGVKRSIASLNGPQQLRLRQALKTAPQALDNFESLVNQFEQVAPQFAQLPLNRLVNKAGREWGAMGPEAQHLAVQIATQTVDVQPELAQIIMAGGVPGERSLAMAEAMVRNDFAPTFIRDQIHTTRQNLSYRLNAINSSLALMPGGAELPPLGGETPATPPKLKEGYIRVAGPNGESGQVPKGKKLPDGWKAVE